MSVIFIGAEDLGEVVAALPPTFDKAHACEVLAKYSIANARAYTRSYPHESCTPHTSEDIELASNVAVDEPLEPWQTKRRRAESTTALLIYNAIANDGTCFLDDIDRAAIVELEMAVARISE